MEPPKARPALRAPSLQQHRLSVRALAVLAAGATAAALRLDCRTFAGVLAGRAPTFPNQGSRASSRLAMRGKMSSANQLTIVRPKPRGFDPGDRPPVGEISEVKAGPGRQKVRFFEFAKQGYPVSEIFMKFEGKTPWKRLGEMVTTNGHFEEAIQAQWTILADHSYLLHKKSRVYLPSSVPITFGYSNERMEIVPVTSGPLAEATPCTDLKDMLAKTGFLGGEKPPHWQHMYAMHRKYRETSRKNKHMLKPWLNHPEYYNSLKSQKSYKPQKYMGTYREYQGGQKRMWMGIGKSR